MSFYERGRQNGDFETGIQSALERMLADPKFIYRYEFEPANVKEGELFARRLATAATAPLQEEVRELESPRLLVAIDRGDRVSDERGLPVVALRPERPVLALVRPPLGELPRRRTRKELPDGQAEMRR